MHVESKAVEKIAIEVRVEDIPPGVKYQPEQLTLARRLKMVKASYVETMECCSNVQTNNHIFNKVFLRSLSDLRMLYMLDAGDVFYSAGVPWYDALFGRDSIIASMQVIPYNPAISKSTLQLLARHQGKTSNAWRDEEPGKILHEMRVGEKANLNEIPQNPYYGSVDSTPLFLIGLAEHIDWTGDMGLFHDLESNVEAGLAWIDAFTDKDGFLRYSERSSFGLYNQGWKDSFDSISHADGTLAKSPVALAEVNFPADCCYIMETKDCDQHATSGTYYSGEGTGRNAALCPQTADYRWPSDGGHRTGTVTGRHQGGLTVIFCDGHAKWMRQTVVLSECAKLDQSRLWRPRAL
jgi:prepilin-type processing-associated H-X9-DG protein